MIDEKSRLAILVFSWCHACCMLPYHCHGPTKHMHKKPVICHHNYIHLLPVCSPGVLHTAAWYSSISACPLAYWHSQSSHSKLKRCCPRYKLSEIAPCACFIVTDKCFCLWSSIRVFHQSLRVGHTRCFSNVEECQTTHAQACPLCIVCDTVV